MATYVIGDIQGCSEPLERLLARIRFDPAADRLWLAGDLVNRGPDSLSVLRLLRRLRASVVAVLGNHDLHLLGRAAGVSRARRRDTVDELLEAPDRDELLLWLRHRPLLHREDGWVLVHAGLLPQWTVEEAAALAGEAEAALRGRGWARLLASYGDDGADTWTPVLAGVQRLKVVLNAFTRLRLCTPEGRMDFDATGPPEPAPAGLVPWFAAPGRRSAEATIVFGHWAAMGLRVAEGYVALDSGCVWGRRLTALRTEDRKIFAVDCPR